MSATPFLEPWLDALVAALDAAETGPSEIDLTKAPKLDHWRALESPSGAPILWGKASGHPRLGDIWITTSHLIAINIEQGWARTVSRWYVLETPFVNPAASVGSSLDAHDAAPDYPHVDIMGYCPLDDITKLSQLLVTWSDRIRQSKAAGARYV
jgi:hypothetical protein